MPLYIGLLGLFDVEMGTHLRRQMPEHRVSKDPSTGPYLGARRQDGTSILQIALVPKNFQCKPHARLPNNLRPKTSSAGPCMYVPVTESTPF